MPAKIWVSLGPLVWEEIENAQTVHRGLAKLLIFNSEYPVIPGSRDIIPLHRRACAVGEKKIKNFDVPLGGRTQRQETLDLPYLTLLCDNMKNRMFLQNFFS
jgi:hypothetical protein